MELKPLKPRLSLNKAFLKVKPNRPEIELFKKNLIGLIDAIDEFELEEFHKNEVSKFLQNTYYSGNHYINTKDRKDLVIHNGTTASSTVGVIIEAKKPTNKAEMLRPDTINCKAFQELVYYYLQERITNKNTEIKHLIATNIYEWYIFDAQLFERLLAQNKPLVKKFIDFEEGRSGGNKTDFFYSEIAAPAIASLTHEVAFTYFDIRDYEKPLRNNNPKDDNLLIALYKLLSPEHLLKLPFANDSNSLDKTFYTELLHIIGLTETKEGGKKLIQRKEKGQRNSGSLIESAIVQLDNLDKIARLEKPSQFGDTTDERLFNVALELSITWINRILFLKLLEAQLIKYHKGDKTYAFLNTDKIKGFDDLNTLFFQVLAKKADERNDEVKRLFAHVPYLNSSLFEPTDIEHACLFISQLKDGCIPVLSNSVIKDKTGKKRTGELPAIEYIFEFLNAYDFSSEGSEEIQEDNKRLINASVLGLIFEKINGYKDGSFFTPGFITMYMCRETIRRAVVQKFNDAKGWNCKELGELYDKIEDRAEANAIINSLKICDPAVGSGHFLVSALNEIIAIKSELRILSDREGKRLKEYTVAVENDELVVTDEDGQLFEYNPNSKESQRVQETLFHEKQTIIENCLFGVDINPNSVKICRLRLWIELLKNAYYRTGHDLSLQRELETLPNIDINIKCGNSLISRFTLDSDLKQALKNSKYSIISYRSAVDLYRNAENKEQKREMEKLIATIKSDFKSKIDDPFKKTISVARAKVDNLASQINTKKQWGEKVDKKVLTELEKAVAKLEKLEKERDDIKANKIFENAFEWRFEFPEVLNDEGDFVGFDVVIGNPPYGVKAANEEKEYFKSNYSGIIGKYDSYGFFIEKGLSICRDYAQFGYIIPHTWLTVVEAQTIRDLILKEAIIKEIDQLPAKVFEDATVETTNLFLEKNKKGVEYNVKVLIYDLSGLINSIESFSRLSYIPISDWILKRVFNLKIGNGESLIIKKMLNNSKALDQICEMSVGVQAYDSYTGQSKELIDARPYHCDYKKDDTFVRELNGRDIQRFSISWGNTWISYGNWLAHPRQKKFFNQDRILIREINSDGRYSIVGSFDNTFQVSYKSIINIILKPEYLETYNLKFLLGIINSRLMSWYFRLTSNKIVTATFPRISIYDLKDFPIKHSELLCEKIGDIVNKILRLKQDFQSTTLLESEIDQLVYQLYGLSEEEIRIVEG